MNINKRSAGSRTVHGLLRSLILFVPSNACAPFHVNAFRNLEFCTRPPNLVLELAKLGCLSNKIITLDDKPSILPTRSVHFFKGIAVTMVAGMLMLVHQSYRCNKPVINSVTRRQEKSQDSGIAMILLLAPARVVLGIEESRSHSNCAIKGFQLRRSNSTSGSDN